MKFHVIFTGKKKGKKKVAFLTLKQKGKSPKESHFLFVCLFFNWRIVNIVLLLSGVQHSDLIFMYILKW